MMEYKARWSESQTELQQQLKAAKKVTDIISEKWLRDDGTVWWAKSTCYNYAEILSVG